jgi:hypothetical protein
LLRTAVAAWLVATAFPGVAFASRELDSGPAGPPASGATRSRIPVGGHPANIVPFTPSPALRGPRRADHLPAFWADGGACAVGCRPGGAIAGWPLRPFHRQHALRAGLNERRTGSLHSGVDIQARNGQAVYAMSSGRAHVIRQGIDTRVKVGRYLYWHVVPAVAEGQGVAAYRTVVGHVITPAGHLHLSETRGTDPSDESYLNPLRPGARVLAPYRDLAPPVIGDPTVRGGGVVDVRAYDPQSFTVRTTYVTPVLAPAALAYRLFDRRGHPVTPLRWALRGTHVYPFGVATRLYWPGARGGGWLCFAYHPRCTPNWHYRLAGGLAPPLPAVPSGRYRLSTYAWDWAGNVTARDDSVRLG